MTTNQIIKFLYSIVPDKISIVCSLGRTAQSVYNFFPNETLFLDSMGDVISTGCGVALGCKTKPVLAIDTDGSFLMGVTILSTLAAKRNELNNFTILVLNNNIYESGGGLRSTEIEPNWKLLGEAWELDILEISSLEELKRSLEDSNFMKFRFIFLNIDNENEPQVDSTKNIDGIESKYLFVRNLEFVLNRVILKPCLKN